MSARFTTLCFFALSILLFPKAAASIIKRDFSPLSNATNVAETVGTNTKNTGRIFEELGRVTSVTDAAGYTVGYSYDDEGNVRTITYPGNRTVTYTYDGANRLKKVTDWNVPARVTTYNYDTAGRLDTVLRPNSTRQRVTFDNANRLSGSYEEKMSGTTVAGTLWQAGYGFDDAQRLTTFTPVPAARSLAPPPAAMTFDGDNQLATYNGQNMGHDLDGNLQSAPLGGTVLGTLTWDKRNRLLSSLSTLNPQLSTSYTYDAENRRLTSTTNGQITRYVWSRGASLDRLLMKVNPDGSTTRYIYGSGLLYEETTLANNTVLPPVYYHFDWRGDTVALSDLNGNVTVRMNYSAYGERTVELVNGTVPTVSTPFCFNGKWGVMTEPTGLLCMQARFYSPVLRRFLNEDPSGFAGGINLYAYTGGDPVNLMDPFGLGPKGFMAGFTSQLTFGNILQGAVYGVGGAVAVAVIGPEVGLAAGLYALKKASDYISGSDNPSYAVGQVTGGLVVGAPGAVVGGGLVGLTRPTSTGTLAAVDGAAATGALRPGEFRISNWAGYPESIPKPTGPLRLLEGAEYDAARAAANQTNRAMHAADESLAGWQLHEIQPVKFGGSPTNIANKMPLPAGAHSEVTNWWNALQRSLEGSR